MLYPATFARFYDAVYSKIRTVDHDFYLNRIRETKGSILEIGVGTGRLFVDALASDADVYGVDVSETMLNVLKKKLKQEEHHRIYLQDATALTINKKFNLIIAPFRMFSHLIEVEQQLQFLDRVHEHLTEVGTFIFDLFVPDPEVINKGIEIKMDFDGEYEPGKRLQRMVSFSPDYIHQTNHGTFKFIWDKAVKEHSEDWNFEMRYFFRYEIEHLIARSKLQLEKIYGDSEGNELMKESKDFVVVCRRA